MAHNVLMRATGDRRPEAKEEDEEGEQEEECEPRGEQPLEPRHSTFWLTRNKQTLTHTHTHAWLRAGFSGLQ